MKRLRRSLLALLILFVLVITSAALYLAITSATQRDARYAVYSAFLEQGRTGNSHDFGDGNGLILILDHTSNGMFRLLVPYHHAQYPLSIMYGMALRNLFSRSLERRFSLGGEYLLIPSTDISSLPEAEQRRSYGVITLSDVTFDHDGYRAFFYTEHLCGLCGGGEFVIMERVGDRWYFTGEDSTWIS